MEPANAEYRIHEGALLRSAPGQPTSLEVFFPKQGWTSYYEAGVWGFARPITPEEAEREMEYQKAMAPR